MKSIGTSSRIAIALAAAALCAGSPAAAAGTALELDEAFAGMRTTVQAAKDAGFIAPATGRWVMDQEDRIGRVVEIHPNGAVRYRVEGDERVSDDLSPELEYGCGIWKGDVVIDPDNEIGTVLRVFQGARNSLGGRDRACRIQYETDGGVYLAKGGLWRRVEEYVKPTLPHFGQKVSRGSFVRTRENETYRVDDVFADGRIAFFTGVKTRVLTRDLYTALRAASRQPDAPGVRETVLRLAVHVSRTCDGSSPRYALQPVSADLGPSLYAEAASLSSEYLYPNKAGLSLELSGDGPGAALLVRSESGTPRRLGTIAREGRPCLAYPAALADLEIADGVSAAIAVEPRTGPLRPACYKDRVNGFHKLDTWTILNLIFPQETMSIKIADGKAFRDKQACLDYYERAREEP